MTTEQTYPCCDSAIDTQPIAGIRELCIRDHCPFCNALIWHITDRNTCETVTDDEFMDRFVLNEQSREATPKDD
jgi:hypothetical protein